MTKNTISVFFFTMGVFMKGLKFILHYLKDNKIKFFSIILVVACYTFFTLTTPLVFQFFIDSVIGSEEITNQLVQRLVDLVGGLDWLQANLWFGGVIILAVATGNCIAVFLRGYLNGIVSESVAFNIRNDLYNRIQYSLYQIHVSSKTGDLIQRCTSDVDTIRRFLAGQFAEMVYSVFTATFACIVLFSIDVEMAKVAIVTMPILVVFGYIFFTRAQKIFLASDESEGEMTSMIQESLSGVRIIKAFNSEKNEMNKFLEKSKDFTDKTFLLLKQLGIYWGSSDFICLSQILLVIIFGILRVQKGDFSVGNYFVFISYESMILWPIRNLGRILADMGKMSVSIGRLEEVLNQTQEDLEIGETFEIEGHIKFDHVSFHYHDSDQLVLDDISFDVKPGQTIALMGPTGSGKSSLVHLLTRLYDVTDGQILIDDHELKDIQKKHLRNNIGLILQEPFLFSKTIGENIRLKNQQARNDELDYIARIASIDEFIQDFDKGYETIVGEKGVTLSGGQKQRVAIARTIINRTPILIFDDSLSAVDTQTDASIRKGMKELQKDTTTIIITQRVASAMDADQILILEKGKITQTGTHDELLKQEGLYKRIYEIQNAKMEGEMTNE